MAPPHDLPVIDVDRLNQIFADLETMEVVLDSDPLEFGPKRMNGKVARARTLLSQCERIFLQVSHDLQLYKRTHRSAQLAFDLQMQDMLANDPETRAGRNVRDRDAIATMKMRPEREQLMSLEVTIQDLEMVLTVVKAKRADMRDIQVRLAQQQKLCEAEIGIGAKWGSKPPPGTDTPNLDTAPLLDQSALDRIQDLLDSEAGEVHLETGDESWLGVPDTEFVEIAEGHDEYSEPLTGAVSDQWWVGMKSIGWCGIPNCGKPVYRSYSGSCCTEGHGGADVLPADPALVSQAPEPEVQVLSQTTEPEIQAREPVVPEPEMSPDSVDFADLFDDADTSIVATAMPSVTTDADVDALFDRMVEPPSAKPKVVVVPDEDIDSLIDMFSS